MIEIRFLMMASTAQIKFTPEPLNVYGEKSWLIRKSCMGVLLNFFMSMMKRITGRSSQSVSKEYDIPLEYLLKILQQLVRANVLRSKRGPRGGFSLAKPTNKITMLEIIEAVDGPMSGELNLAEQAKGEKFSGKADAVYEKAVASARSVFNKAKLSALIDPKK